MAISFSSFRRAAQKGLQRAFGGVARTALPAVAPPGFPTSEEALRAFAPPLPAIDPAALAAERERAPLAALKELRLAGIPAARRRAFTPFAQRGFGASGLARRGVKQALGAREAQFARERERIRAEVLARAVQEALAQEEIRALRRA